MSIHGDDGSDAARQEEAHIATADAAQSARDVAAAFLQQLMLQTVGNHPPPPVTRPSNSAVFHPPVFAGSAAALAAVPPPPGFAAAASPGFDRSDIGSALTDEQWRTALNLFTKMHNPTGNMPGKLVLPWILDSGASYHMTGAKGALSDIVTADHTVDVVLPDGSISTACEYGTITFGGITLPHVLYIPELRCNLLSCSRLLGSLKCLALLTENYCILQKVSSRIVIGVGEQYGGVYWLRTLDDGDSFRPPPSRAAAVPASSSSLWHQRFGHPSSTVLSSLFLE